uniref:Uncharacterized protein n=1 Tax=Theileria parva TaxID=5875 RepID=Q4N6C9_THEPA|eukprot:XP_764577.1 hypothetical protein [Theileria parva strain Muguga]
MYKMIFELNSKLEQILCDGKKVWNHKSKTPYPLSLTYFKNRDSFTFNRKGDFLLITREKERWVIKGVKGPTHIQLYKKGSDGNEIKLTKNEYSVCITGNGSLKLKINADVECSKIRIRNKVFWEKNDYPRAIYLTQSRNILLEFKEYKIVFGRRAGIYFQMYSTRNKKAGKYP